MLFVSLLRHAKSDWGTPGLDDIDRPLNKRGKKQARQMGHFISRSDVTPDLIICSSAKRARQTLKQARKNWPSNARVIFEDRLYLASPDTILKLLKEQSDQSSQRDTPSHIMIIGHNPGLHMLATGLVTSANQADMQILQERYPTGTLCVIKSKAEKWNDLQDNSAELLIFATPKSLADNS